MWGDVHIEALVPVGVQRLLDDARGARLLAIDRGHSEGIREACSACVSVGSVRREEGVARGQVRTEDIALVEAIGGNDCIVLARLTAVMLLLRSVVEGGGGGGDAGDAGGRTGDAQVGLPSSVHGDGDARVRGISGATGRLSELAGVRVCYQRRCCGSAQAGGRGSGSGSG